MNLEFYSEIHCEICNDVMHNHFDCPACGEEYTGTSVYYDIYELETGDTIQCESCGQEFLLVEKTGDWHDEWTWYMVDVV